MKTRLSALAVIFAVLVSQQAVNAQPPGYNTAVGYFAQVPAGTPSPNAECQDGAACCDPCFGQRPDCCDPWQVYGGYMSLRARNVEVTFGVPTTDTVLAPGTVPTQTGAFGVVDGRYDPGFQVGLARKIGEWSTVGLTYSHFDTSSTTQIDTIGTTQQIVPMTVHPTELATNPFFDSALGQQNIDFRILDAEFRNVFASGYYYDLAFVGGARYVNLRQSAEFAYFDSLDATVGEFVFSHLKFDGGGIRLGLEGERRAPNSGLLLYGKTAASFVAGQFRADYIEAHMDGTNLVDTSWKANRIVSILDLEVGAGWTGPGGRLRVTGGYMVSGWFNTVKTSDWIRAVQTNNLTGLSDTITFDGLVGRIELRF